MSPSSYLPPHHPDQPEPPIPQYDLSTISDEAEDHPSADEVLPPATAGSDGLVLPAVLIGGGPFGYGIYADDALVSSSMPLRVVRLALRSGINAFDLSPSYHPAEILVGNALYALREEYPRESYTLITKAGKFGSTKPDHVYDPESIRKSVERSLKRLRTDYLDVVYLHDVEFIADSSYIPISNPISHLSSSSSPPHTPLGSGDRQILSALAALRTLQSQGKIRKVGIAGYPLPLLLRLAHLIQHETGQPLDIVQTYGCQTVQNPALEAGYLEAFRQAGVGRVMNAAPLAMGLLTSGGGQAWHPAKRSGGGLAEGCAAAARKAEEMGGKLEVVASRYGYRDLTLSGEKGGERVPVVIGCKDLGEVHRTLRSFADVNGEGEGAEEKQKADEVEREVIKVLEEKGVRGLSWTCGMDQ